MCMGNKGTTEQSTNALSVVAANKELSMANTTSRNTPSNTVTGPWSIRQENTYYHSTNTLVPGWWIVSRPVTSPNLYTWETLGYYGTEAEAKQALAKVA